jgi:penicillin-binding protein 2
VREGMRRSVTEGPNVAARDACSNLQIAGKTGTAEFGNLIDIPPVNGKPRAPIRQSHSWFVGFAPYDNPQIEVLALVEGSGDMNDGSATITVPAVTQIMQAYFKVAPPNPLPRGCQMDMPPLPARVEVGTVPKTYVRSGPGR